MQPGHAPSTRRRSAFSAAFLSLLFPGLGHAYLGAYRRALGFAAPPVLVGALVAGFAVRLNAFELAGMAIQTWFLQGVFIANLVALAYRAGAIIDAWAIARAMDRPVGAPAPLLRTAGLASLGGLLAVLIVMSGLHVLVARYDLLVSSTADCIFNTSASCAPTESPAPSSQPTEASTGSTEPPTPAPSIGPEVSQPSLPPWDGKQRLNILLIGADEQGGGHRTDTMIVVSIDPKTNEVVMFQLPRDTVDVPVPPGPARQLFGSVFGGKINAYLSAVSNRPDLYPGKGLATGYNGLKAILGGLYGIDIPYFVEVNFSGFRQVVDALGGVTINVQVPITDDRYPGSNGDLLRLYIPAGVQHFDGAGALQYARSRHNSSDFDRAARQQRILVSLRRQVDIQQILPNLDSLAAAISHSITTDIPRELVPQLLSLAQQVDTKTIRSVIFTPPYYQTQCLNCTLYKLEPNIARIRAAVKDAFQVDPGFAEARDAIAGEGATVWVLNGSGRPGQASSLATYLNYLGMAATAPTQKPDTTGLSGTTIRAYNGAEESFPLTIAALEQQLGVTKVELVTDPTVSADIVVITAKNTPQLTAPPRP